MTCRVCGVTAPGNGRAPTALGWSWERAADGRLDGLCPDCTRRHTRDIEAKLPDQWWAE